MSSIFSKGLRVGRGIPSQGGKAAFWNLFHGGRGMLHEPSGPPLLITLLCLGSCLLVEEARAHAHRQEEKTSIEVTTVTITAGIYAPGPVYTLHTNYSHLILLNIQQTKNSKSNDHQKCSLNHFLASAWLLLSCLKPALPLYISLPTLLAWVAQVAVSNATLVALSCRFLLSASSLFGK